MQKNRQEKRSSKTIKKYLLDVAYPATKSKLIEAAQEKGANKNVIEAITKIQDDEYKTPADLKQAICNVG